jgi:hypothetical protein
MSVITLKFTPEMKELIIKGEKCCTTRDKKKGEVGDIFRVMERVYRICQISWCTLRCASREMIESEGFKTESEYISEVEKMYPYIVESSIVYLHFFAYVGSYCPQFGINGSVCSDPEEFCELYEDCLNERV